MKFCRRWILKPFKTMALRNFTQQVRKVDGKVTFAVFHQFSLIFIKISQIHSHCFWSVLYHSSSRVMRITLECCLSDMDECSHPELNVCHPDATCLNTEGSFKCLCKQGFSGDGIDFCTGEHHWSCPSLSWILSWFLKAFFHLLPCVADHGLFFSPPLFLVRERRPSLEKFLSPPPAWESNRLSPGWGNILFCSSSLTALVSSPELSGYWLLVLGDRNVSVSYTYSSHSGETFYKVTFLKFLFPSQFISPDQSVPRHTQISTSAWQATTAVKMLCVPTRMVVMSAGASVVTKAMDTLVKVW